MLKRWVTIFVLLSLMTSGVYGDDSVLGGVGNTVYPIFDTEVQMMGERVDIQIRDRKAFVRCEFLFKNTGKKEKVTIGFPAYGTLPPTEDRQHFGDDLKIYDFMTYVDGKEIQTTIRDGIKPVGNNRDDLYYPKWHVWEMEFEKNQTRRVVNTYWMHNSFDSSGGEWVQYILKTGATWKDVIGYGKITITLDQSISLQDITLRDYQLYKDNENVTLRILPEENKFIWEFYGIEPNFDIGLYYQDRLARFKEAYLETPFSTGEPKELNEIQQLANRAYEAYLNNNYDTALEAIKAINPFKDQEDRQVANYALEVGNYLDYYRALILLEQGDIKGGEHYLRVSGMFGEQNLYQLANHYKTTGDTDQYIQLLNRMVKKGSHSETIQLWAEQERKNLPSGILNRYNINQNEKAGYSKENITPPISQGESPKEQEYSYKGFVIFNMGVVTLIFMVYWNIKKR